MIICSHVYMLWWSHAHLLLYLHVLHLDILLITCSYVQMLWWLHAHMHWYSHVWYPPTCAHNLMMKCLLAWRLNALTIVLECRGNLGNWGVYLGTYILKNRMLLCSHKLLACMLSCSNAHIEIKSHYFLRFIFLTTCAHTWMTIYICSEANTLT